ncbi:MAG TPA: sigma 54-interacting transcriptional regulator [Polyangiaceae bacterium]|jgi:transcriptional regulator with GAF, ATPase, and Fis domain|nr:sigma 54-interacting transcriptional regulator [Polyangiaceae bacterium]
MRECRIRVDVENCDEGLLAPLLAALRERAVEFLPVASAEGSAVLSFFSRLDDALFDRVRVRSRNGLDPLLVVASSRAALRAGAAFRLLDAGASEVIVVGSAIETAEQVVAIVQRWSEIETIIDSKAVADNLVGKSRSWTKVLRQLVEIGRFTEAPALILGESGTGKELAARLLHTIDPRPTKGELVVLDCTTIVPELSGSEFFGHERGAFTGASGARDGAFALADGGTLFLDEVGELPPALQAQLLRVVQERSYKRVGGNAWQTTHFRLVCATNRDLLSEVEAGRFRRDLYYRIASAVVRLPALRDRVEDILPLARHFMRGLRPGDEPPALDEEVRDHLLHRHYPGNVRELRQLVSRLLFRHFPPGPISVGALPEEERSAHLQSDTWRDARFDDAIRRAVVLGAHLKDIGRCAEHAAVRIAVEDEDGNLQRAAARLGVTDRALQMRRAVEREAD